MADPQVGDLAQAETAAPAAGGAPAAEAGAAKTGNRPPEAGDVCATTADNAALGIPVLSHDHDPDGDPLHLLGASQPASGHVSLNPDGTVTFTPVAAGLQSFRYEVGDGHGGQSSADVSVFVNPRGGALAHPVLSGLTDPQLAQVARACAAGVAALHSVPLAGPEVLVRPPQPGTRIEVHTEPGQSIQLGGVDFAAASYLVVDGGLLVITEDGRQVYLSNFVDAAHSGTPPTLSVAGGPAVATDQLLANLQPIGEQAEGGVVGRLPPPEVGPLHGGGAGFVAYNPGDIGPGLEPTGPQQPVAFGRGGEFLLRSTVDTGTGAGGEQTSGPVESGNAKPQLTITGTVTAEVGETTQPIDFHSAPPFPTLTEQHAVDLGLINGVDPQNLVLGPNADASISFRDEIAAFHEHARRRPGRRRRHARAGAHCVPAGRGRAAEPQHPFARPGGGPLHPGDEVRLSDLFDPGQLHEGQHFAFFTIADGYRLNGDLDQRPPGVPERRPRRDPDRPDARPVRGRRRRPSDPGRRRHLPHRDPDLRHAARRQPQRRRSRPGALGPRARRRRPHDLVRGQGPELRRHPERQRLQRRHLRRAAAAVDRQHRAPYPSGCRARRGGHRRRPESRRRDRRDHPRSSSRAMRCWSASLAGTGITLVEDGSHGELVLAGVAPISTYVDVLHSIQLTPRRRGCATSPSRSRMPTATRATRRWSTPI